MMLLSVAYAANVGGTGTIIGKSDLPPEKVKRIPVICIEQRYQPYSTLQQENIIFMYIEIAKDMRVGRIQQYMIQRDLIIGR
mgnify:CR=1 FL=1